MTRIECFEIKHALGFGIYVCDCPYKVTVMLHFLFIAITVGFGTYTMEKD